MESVSKWFVSWRWSRGVGSVARECGRLFWSVLWKGHARVTVGNGVVLIPTGCERGRLAEVKS